MTKKISTHTNPLYTLGELYKSENFKKWYSENTISFKKYRNNWINRPTNSEYGDFPLSLNIEITTKCNLACTFCWHSSLKEEEKIHLEFDDFKKIIDEASNFKIPSINLNGLGEPITHPRLLEMIEYCKSKGVQDILNREPQTIPLPEGQMSMFANTPFKPECCPNAYSNSSGCACMTTNQYNYLVSRGGNNVPYSEY